MMANPSPQLEAVDVSYTYAGSSPTQALDALGLEIQDNEFVALLGPVGCGKTTLLRIFAGFLRPTKGAVRCGGASIDGPSWQEDTSFRTGHLSLDERPGERRVRPSGQGARASARRRVSEELIGLIGLSAFEEAWPKELSAGMSKMVELVRVLATDPSILLLDEPFGALDAQTRARMQDALARLWEQRRKTILFVTHDAEEALYLADRIVVLSPRPGRVKAQFAVDLPRPRSYETRFSSGFLALKRQVWEATEMRGLRVP
jgi:ABC-type nitrate/sulfonate/bicarbonate transport system ATPase subunit